MKSVSVFLAGAFALVAVPGVAATDAEVDCTYQSDVVQAVRQARLDGVKERTAPDHIKAASPTWPDKYNAVIPLIAPWVYEMKMRDLKANDLAAAWKEMCLEK